MGGAAQGRGLLRADFCVLEAIGRMGGKACGCTPGV